MLFIFYNKQNDYGSLELLGSKSDALQNVSLGENIQYKLRFPIQQPLPKLTEISYNNKMICWVPPETAGYGYAVTSIKLEHTFKTQVSNGEGIKNRTPSIGSVSSKPATSLDR